MDLKSGPFLRGSRSTDYSTVKMNRHMELSMLKSEASNIFQEMVEIFILLDIS